MSDTWPRSERDEQDEIARLTGDVALLRAALAQAERAMKAERRARQIAEADNEGLRSAARSLTRSAARQVTGYDDAVVLILRMALNDLNRAIDQPHPGAQLLTELEAARSVAECARTWIDWPAMNQALATYDEATKARAD